MNDLVVIRHGVRMNRHCSHRPSEAKDCPYCDICEHGATAYMHCEECNKDKSWMEGDITDKEMLDLLEELEAHHLGYMERNTPKRWYHCGPKLMPMFIARVRKALGIVT